MEAMASSHVRPEVMCWSAWPNDSFFIGQDGLAMQIGSPLACKPLVCRKCRKSSIPRVFRCGLYGYVQLCNEQRLHSRSLAGKVIAVFGQVPMQDFWVGFSDKQRWNRRAQRYQYRRTIETHGAEQAVWRDDTIDYRGVLLA